MYRNCQSLACYLIVYKISSHLYNNFFVLMQRSMYVIFIFLKTFFFQYASQNNTFTHFVVRNIFCNRDELKKKNFAITIFHSKRGQKFTLCIGWIYMNHFSSIREAQKMRTFSPIYFSPLFISFVQNEFFGLNGMLGDFLFCVQLFSYDDLLMLVARYILY